eukprot:3941265-Rhodomonas_salina.2
MTDLQGSGLGAVVDVGVPQGSVELSTHPRAIDLGWRAGEGRYFNAGVLLMDLAKLRLDLEFWKRVAADEIRRPVLEGNPGSLQQGSISTAIGGGPFPHKDQDVLNIWLRKARLGWFPLDHKWNAQGLGTYAKHRLQASEGLYPAVFTIDELQHLERDSAIVHFTGCVSPSLFGVASPFTKVPSKPWGFWRGSFNPFSTEWWMHYERLRQSFTAAGLTDFSDVTAGWKDEVANALLSDIDELGQLASRLGHRHVEAVMQEAHMAIGFLCRHSRRFQAAEVEGQESESENSVTPSKPTVSIRNSSFDSELEVAIVGGAGMIGSQVVALLAARGVNVRVIDSFEHGSLSHLPGDARRVSIARHDIRNVSRYGALFHQSKAAVLLAPHAETFKPCGCPFYGQMGVEVTEAFCRAATAARCIKTVVLVCSSCSLKEDAMTASISPEIRSVMRQRGIALRVVRLPNVYGCSMHNSDIPNHILSRLLLLGMTNTLAHAGTAEKREICPLLHVSDAAAAVVEACFESGYVSWPVDPETSGMEISFSAQSSPKTVLELCGLIERITDRAGERFSTTSEVESTVWNSEFNTESDAGDAGGLGWQPKTSIDMGVVHLAATILRRKGTPLMVGLPITSRGISEETAEARLKCLAAGLPREAHCYVAVDCDDEIYALKDLTWFSSILGRPCTKIMLEPQVASVPFATYAVYNELVQTGLRDGKHFFVLLGDDVRLSNNSWFPALQERFKTLQSISCVDRFGFGVVAIHDTSAPGFPTFPVVHRTHIELMKGRFCPEDFVNQDADPWVWELYRRFGAAVFLDPIHVTLDNGVGGAEGTPRYERNHLHGWKDGLLAQSIDRVRRQCNVPESALTTTIDVVIPSFRVATHVLEKIVRMQVPDTVSTLFIIIIDNPESPNIEEVKNFESTHSPRVRVRVQSSNMGVAAARNRGIDESAADWILFLDDDVEPSQHCLREYAKSVEAFGHSASGFVGPSTFPRPANLHTRAVQLSDITYFWNLADKPFHPWQKSCSGYVPTPIPWGVTANLVLKRLASVRFRAGFPATGGGEDIAMCLDTQAALGLPLRACVAGHVEHPWWGGGRFSSWRFFAWTQGDGLLVDLYPHLTFRAPPNVVELSALAAVVGVSLLALPNSFSDPAGKLAAVGGWVAYIWVCEIAMDAMQLLTDGRLGWTQEDAAKGWAVASLNSIAASLLATKVKNHVELGHLWVHAKRGRLFNLCKRFDWFCGLWPEVVALERSKALQRLLVFSAPLAFLVFSPGLRRSIWNT